MQTLSKKIKLHTYEWLKSNYTTLDFKYYVWRRHPRQRLLSLLEALLFMFYVVTKLLLIDYISL